MLAFLEQGDRGGYQLSRRELRQQAPLLPEPADGVQPVAHVLGSVRACFFDHHGPACRRVGCPVYAATGTERQRSLDHEAPLPQREGLGGTLILLARVEGVGDPSGAVPVGNPEVWHDTPVRVHQLLGSPAVERQLGLPQERPVAVVHYLGILVPTVREHIRTLEPLELLV